MQGEQLGLQRWLELQRQRSQQRGGLQRDLGSWHRLSTAEVVHSSLPLGPRSVRRRYQDTLSWVGTTQTGRDLWWNGPGPYR